MMKEIKNFQGYFISEQGQVWSKKSNKFLKAYNANKGYLQVALRQNGETKRQYVHRLVAQTFLDNPDPQKFTQVNHKNGIRTDNRLSNLEWVTPTQNLNVMNNIQIELKQTLQKAIQKQGYEKILEILKNNC